MLKNISQLKHDKMYMLSIRKYEDININLNMKVREFKLFMIYCKDFEFF